MLRGVVLAVTVVALAVAISAGPVTSAFAAPAGSAKICTKKVKRHGKIVKKRVKCPKPKPTATLTVNPDTLTYSGGQATLTYSSSRATACSLSASSTLWSGANPLTVSCNGSTDVTVPVSPSGGQWTVKFTAQGTAGKASSSGTLTQQAPTYQRSANWSGYVVPSTSVLTDVSGSFTVPTLDCAVTPDAGESTWVGIGGLEYSNGGSSGDLLQTGVQSDCVSGVQVTNAAWWEDFPINAEQDFGGFTVNPGDVIDAYAYQWADGSRWETCLDDVTTGVSGLEVTGEGWGVTTGGCGGTFTFQETTPTLDYAGGYTAEWIVEDYGVNFAQPNVYAPFADYGTVTFSNIVTSMSSWSLSSAEGMAMVQNGSVLSTPLAPSGTGFSVTYTG